MNQKPLRRLSLSHALLLTLAMGGAGAACGGEEPVSQELSALTDCNPNEPSSVTPRYGSDSGTREGFVCEVGSSTAVTFVTAYASSDRVYGIELKWGTAVSKLFGVTNGLSPTTLDATNDAIRRIKVCVDSNGVLTGVRFITISTAVLTAGYNCGAAYQTVFDDVDDVLTNMRTWRDTSLVGVKFTYTGPEY